jgi:hypothetical protein
VISPLVAVRVPVPEPKLEVVAAEISTAACNRLPNKIEVNEAMQRANSNERTLGLFFIIILNMVVAVGFDARFIPSSRLHFTR